MKKIADGIGTFQQRVPVMGQPFVVYPVVLWDEKSVTLVDTGLYGQMEELVREIKKTGLSMEQLDTVILTHHDADHTGNLPALVQAGGGKLEVCASELERPYIEGTAPTPPAKQEKLDATLASLPEAARAGAQPIFGASFPAPVTRTVQDGDILPICGGIKVILTPGHTPGHISLYHIASRTLITGDAMILDSRYLLGPAPQTATDIDQAVASLDKLKGLDVAAVVCYHGGFWKGNFANRIAELTKR